MTRYKGPPPKQPPPSKRPRGIQCNARQEWTPERIGLLCESIRQHGHLGIAARSVGTSKRNVIAKRQKDEAFDALVSEAECAAQLSVIEVVRKLGLEGVFEPIYQGGELVGTRRVYNTRAMELEARRLVPEYRDRPRVEADDDADDSLTLRYVPENAK